MDSDKIELLAVNCITDQFAYSNKIKTYIPTNDKEPVWDGHIYICTSKGNYYRIPAQVKGKLCKHIPKKPSYPVSLINLRNYKRDGGILYFVVFIKDNERFPYYASLAPIDLKRLIKYANGQASISIPLEPLPLIQSDIESELIEFYFDCKRHTSFSDSEVLTLDETIKKGYPITYRVHNATNQVDALLKLGDRYRYIYANIGNGKNPIYVPIGDQPFKLMPFPTVDKPVSVNEHTFFPSYQEGHSSYERIIIIDEFFRITSDKVTQKAQLEATLNTSSLSRYINQVQFLYNAFNAGYFNLGTERIEFNEISKDDLDDIKNRLAFWTRVVDVLNLIHVNLDLVDITNYGDEEIEQLKLLCSLILDNQSVKQDKELSTVSVLELGDFSVLLLSEKQKNGKYTGKDFFSIANSKCVYIKDDNAHSVVLPIYSAVFYREDAHKLINIDYDHILEQYEKASTYCHDISIYVNQDVLNMIMAYDRQVKKDIRLINAALSLANWLISKYSETEHSYIYQINKYQILLRKNLSLTSKEINELLDLSESDIPANAKWAILILLKDVTRAERYWNKLTDEEKLEHKNFPIYTLAKKISSKYE